MLSALLLACFGCCCSIAHIQQHLNLLDRHAAAQCNGEPLFLVHVISRKIPDWPSREPIRIGSHLKLTTSAIMYHSTSLFLPDPAWKSRKSATVSMLSATGRPRGYAWCGGSPSGSRPGPGRRSAARFRLLSYLDSSRAFSWKTCLVSAKPGRVCRSWAGFVCLRLPDSRTRRTEEFPSGAFRRQAAFLKRRGPSPVRAPPFAARRQPAAGPSAPPLCVPGSGRRAGGPPAAACCPGPQS